MLSILSIFLVFMGIVYLGAPLIVLAQQRMEACPKMLRIELQDYEWPEEIECLFSVAIDDLTEIGFEIIDCLFLPSSVNNVKTALILFANRQEMDSAMVTAIYAQPITFSSLRTLYLEFSTRIKDDAEYNTNNSMQLSSFPAPHNTTTYQLIKIQKAKFLYQAHRAIMERDGRDRSQKTLVIDRDFEGDAAAYLQNAMGEEFKSAASDGYLKLAPNGKEYRLTLKGAYLMVWKELWPWKLFRKIKRDRKENQLVAELSRTGVEIRG